ncbi:siphovirus Gp157 family protein [Facklamia languida]
MNIYELNDKYQQILDLLQSVDISNNDEYRQILEDTLESISDALNDKVEGYVKIIAQMKSDQEQLKIERDRINERIRSFNNNTKRMQTVLYDTLKASGKEKVKTPLYSIWIQQNPPSIEVLDELEIPNEYWVEQLPTLDKRQLLADLKEGKEVKGAQIKQGEGVRYG